MVRALFRMTNTATNPLFPTLTPSNKKLLHFRFVAHSFVMSLSSYVYDTVIRGRYDEFIRKVSPPFKDGHLETTHIMRNFSDVFALADFHSQVLDDILSACLLRSGQKAVGDYLRELLEIVLKFGILAGDLKEGRLQEYQATPALDDLFRLFQNRMVTVVRTPHTSLPRHILIHRSRSRSYERWLTKAPGRLRCLLAHIHKQLWAAWVR